MDPLALVQTRSDLDFLDKAALSAMTAIVTSVDVTTLEDKTLQPGSADYGQIVAKASYLIATAMLEQRDVARSLYQQALDELEEAE